MTLEASYGDVTAEYLAAREGAAVIEGTREIVWVRGSDATEFLEGLLSQSIVDMGAGSVRRSLLLSPQGKLRALLWVLRGDEEIGLVADSGFGSVVMGDLSRFKIRVDVELTPEEAPMVEVWGPTAPEVVAAAGAVQLKTGHWERTDGLVVARLRPGSSGLEQLLVVGAAADQLVSAGGVRVGLLAATAIRIEAGEPMMGIDVDEATIPQEAGIVEGSVDFDKGCYLGQELVARIDSRGRVNRHLRGLVIGESIIPPPGASIRQGDADVGVVSSAGESLELRAPVALALIRREVALGDEVRLEWKGGAASAQVRLLPLDDLSGS